MARVIAGNMLKNSGLGERNLAGFQAELYTVLVEKRPDSSHSGIAFKQSKCVRDMLFIVMRLVRPEMRYREKNLIPARHDWHGYALLRRVRVGYLEKTLVNPDCPSRLSPAVDEGFVPRFANAPRPIRVRTNLDLDFRVTRVLDERNTS